MTPLDLVGLTSLMNHTSGRSEVVILPNLGRTAGRHAYINGRSIAVDLTEVPFLVTELSPCYDR
jgi:hypothetical protein